MPKILQKKIIPCLDIRDGRVVKGKKFKDIQDVANPVELAKKYEKDGADVLFLLDIIGKDRAQFLQIVKEIKAAIAIPLYVGGGIRTVDDVKETLAAGATKVSITSAAIADPSLLSETAKQFGGEKLVLSIDAQQVAPHKWHAFTSGGKTDSQLDAVAWAVKGEELGASEILLNSIDADGIKEGYDLPLNKAVSEAVQIPVIASGGAGKADHFVDVLSKGGAQAALAASVFHYNEIPITELKLSLKQAGIEIGER